MSTKISHRRAVKNLEQILPIAKDNAKHDPYLHGMANGLIMAHNCLTGKEPDFVTQIGRYRIEKFKRGNAK